MWNATYKENWTDAIPRMQAWWDGAETDRPIVLSPVLTAPRPWHPPAADAAETARRSADPAFYVAWRRHHLEECVFPAESAPSTWSNYGNGLGLVAAVAGASIRYAPGTAWIDEIPDLYVRRELPRFDPQHPAVRFAEAMLRAFDAAFGRDAVLGGEHLLDPVTTLSMMRGPANLCIDLIEQPDAAARWIRALGDIFLGIKARLREVRGELGRPDDFHPIGMWAAGTIEALQCDFSTMLSPAMFREFVMPEVEREAEAVDYPLWHLDGTDEFRHLADICSVRRIRAVQWVDEQKGRDPNTFLDQWKQVRAARKSLVIQTTVDAALELTRRLGPAGLAFRLHEVTSVAMMEATLETLKA
ncbi:MAG: hypothetical protein JW951_10315 [Lentisphaerae bacterium]|nr:hypothetical protein [Lentisphaerota bacterium]